MGTAALWTGAVQLTIETVRNSTDPGDTDFSEHEGLQGFARAE